MQRVKAYTLMEMGIAMLVSAIVIGITYTAYRLIMQSYASYKVKNEKVSVIVRLDELLKKDLDGGDKILLLDSSLVFKNDSQRVVYDFKPGVIIRSGGAIDSFKVEHTSLLTTFENQRVIPGMPEAQSLIEEISFSIVADKEIFPYHYHKAYSSLNLIEK